MNVFGTGYINVEYSKSDFKNNKAQKRFRSYSKDDSRARGRLAYSRNPPNSRIFLGCLSADTRERDIRDAFERFGEI